MNHVGTTKPAPVKPTRLLTVVEEERGELRLRYRRREWAGGIFLCLWLTGWTVGCVVLAVGALSGEYFLFLFGTPFWAAWFFVAYQVAKMFFQKGELRLSREGVHYERRILMLRWERRVPLVELQEFVAGFTPPGYNQSKPIFRMDVQTTGDKLTCLENVSEDEVRWLTWRLNGLLAQLTNRSAEKEYNAVEVTPPQEIEQVTPPQGGREILLPGDVPPLPTGSRLRRELVLGEVVFESRGEFSAGAVFGLLFLNLFWNGIVSVFVAVLFGAAPGKDNPALGSGQWWAMFVFLIPFEVIGLAMFLVFLAALLAPFSSVRWAFTLDGIIRTWTIMGLSRSKQWPARNLDRIEIGPADQTSGFKANVKVNGESLSKDLWKLVLIDRENQEVCSLENLNQGEARHIGQTLLKERIKWFS